MARRACLAIGVSSVTPPKNQALRFGFLEGAVLAARAIGAWALASSFGAENVRIVDDGQIDGKENPVTRERVQRAVDELFPTGADVVEHLILAFCGHGLTDANAGSISWLFSDSMNSKYRVVANMFYEELLLHGVQRITLITDACREAPKTLDLTRFDQSRGIVVHGTRVESPKFDRLAACQDGQLGYMVSEQNPAVPGKCVFSGVIADVLWGNEPTAIANGVITTTSLGLCVRARTPERARDYRLKLNPECLVDPEAAILYTAERPPAGPPGLQPWPAAGSGTIMGLEVATAVEASEVDRNLERVHTNARFRNRILGRDFGLKRHDFAAADAPLSIPDDSKDLLQDLITLRTASVETPAGPERSTVVRAMVQRLEADAASDARQRAAGEVQHRLGEIRPDPSANLVVLDEGAKLWSRHKAQRVGGTSSQSEFYVLSDLRGAPILIEFADGSFTPLVPYAGLFAALKRSPTGDVFQAYGEHNSSGDFRDALKAIADFAAGVLGVDRIDKLASQLRHQKHADPTLGAICAHLYRAVADFDSIRRMAYFYAKHNQPVPFDIALLGAMKVTRESAGALTLHIPAVKERAPNSSGLPDYVTQATPEASMWVAGRCPWVASGWDYVSQPRTEWAILVDDLAAYANDIRRSGFTILPNTVGASLAKAWQLQPN